jgi:hypothetical protein
VQRGLKIAWAPQRIVLRASWGREAGDVDQPQPFCCRHLGTTLRGVAQRMLPAGQIVAARRAAAGPSFHMRDGMVSLTSNTVTVCRVHPFGRGRDGSAGACSVILSMSRASIVRQLIVASACPDSVARRGESMRIRARVIAGFLAGALAVGVSAAVSEPAAATAVARPVAGGTWTGTVAFQRTFHIHPVDFCGVTHDVSWDESWSVRFGPTDDDPEANGARHLTVNMPGSADVEWTDSYPSSDCNGPGHTVHGNFTGKFVVGPQLQLEMPAGTSAVSPAVFGGYLDGTISDGLNPDVSREGSLGSFLGLPKLTPATGRYDGSFSVADDGTNGIVLGDVWSSIDKWPAGRLTLKLKRSASTRMSCDDPGVHTKQFSPDYDARRKLRLIPDMVMFRFRPRFTACWDGQHAAWEVRHPSAAVNGTPASFILEQLGFTLHVKHTDGKDVLQLTSRSGSSADAEARSEFDIRFHPNVFLSKLGVVKKLKEYAGGKLARKLGAYLRKNPNLFRLHPARFSAKVGMAANRLARKLTRATDEIEPWLVRHKVPKSVARWFGNLAHKWARSIESRVNRLASATIFPARARQLGAKALAKLVVNKIFKLLIKIVDKTIDFFAWQPDYAYHLTRSGHISEQRTNLFLNPYLTTRRTN